MGSFLHGLYNAFFSECVFSAFLKAFFAVSHAPLPFQFVDFNGESALFLHGFSFDFFSSSAVYHACVPPAVGRGSVFGGIALFR